MSDTAKTDRKPTAKKSPRSSGSSVAGQRHGILMTGAVALPMMLAYFRYGPAYFTRWLAIDTKLAAEPTYRLVFALRWLAPVCLLLVLCVQAVATSRLLSPAIDGRTPNRLTDLLRSILQNTAEQALLLALNLLALSQNVAPDQLVLVPMLVAMFCLARVIFAVGYLISPSRRALGFILTFGPNTVTAGYNVYCLARF